MSPKNSDKEVGEVPSGKEEVGAYPPSVPRTSARTRMLELPFVDRKAELATMQSMLEETINQQSGTILFLSGEPGVGKTRLAEEFLKQASGVRHFFTRCSRVESLTPYAPWIDIIRQFARQAPISLFYEVCGENVDEIIRLLPELMGNSDRRKVNRNPPPTSDPELISRNRLKFFQAMSTFFVRLSRESPVLLVFDDLQWIDPASLGLFQFIIDGNVLRENPISVVGLHRDLDPKETPLLFEFLNNLERQVRPHRTAVRLDRLDSHDVSQLVLGCFSSQKIIDDLVDLIYRKTRGNPLFVEEILRSLVEEEKIFRNQDGKWDSIQVSRLQIPDGVKSVIEQRLKLLDERSLEMLRLACVIGDKFDSRLLRRLMALGGLREETEGKVIQLMEHILGTSLVREDEASDGNVFYLFQDESVRDVLYEEISLSRKKSYHHLIARAMEELFYRQGDGKDSTEGDAGEIARHFLKGGDRDNAIRYYILAADKSRLVFA
ncbi:MAG: AAA family ATPase, partial [Thaumarchaeota archaeon]|nr:AAA family ATPase [Nitrososphaerota archaeon]